MKTDFQIQKDVMAELSWEPLLNATEIGVAVKNGIVTLSGKVNSFTKKIAAEKAAKKVAGVKAVAEDIQVGINPGFIKTDAEIAEAVLNVLKWHTAVQEEKIRIKVENGIVSLDGEVEWEYQRANAKKAIENLQGVRLVINLISVSPKITPHDIQQKISSAFKRNATIDSEKIIVQVSGNKIILRGIVRSMAEKEDAETVAWNAPGILNVENKLEVAIPEYAFAD